jgi:general secretion pathway protein C
MLELFLKKYGWVANLVLLAVAAWLLAKTVNTAVGAAIRPTPRADSGGGPAAPPPPAIASLDVDKLFPLIGQKPPPVIVAGTTPDAPPPPKTCSDLQAAPVATSLRAQLVAGIVAERPLRSVAVIADKVSGQTRTYGIGDDVLSGKLLSVERIRDDRDPRGRSFRVVAIVCNDGRKEYIDFETGGGGAPVAVAAPNVGVAPVPPPAPDASAALPPDGVKKTADNKYDVKKSVLDGTLSNLNSVATQARIVPSFKNGVANGFKVFSIQPNSFYSAIGVENGDVIQKVNGYEINSPDKALEIYQKLREARHVTVDLERNGQTIRKEYNVTGQ